MSIFGAAVARVLYPLNPYRRSATSAGSRVALVRGGMFGAMVWEGPPYPLVDLDGDRFLYWSDMATPLLRWIVAAVASLMEDERMSREDIEDHPLWHLG